ncbi:MAG: M48 family metallopeptidase [Pirellulales bacterium]
MPDQPLDGQPLDDREMTPEERAEARRYRQVGLACEVADKLLDVAYLAVMALLLARPLDACLRGAAWLSDNETLRLIVLYLIVFALHVVVSFPLSFYSGHVVEHRFGLSTQSFARWLGRYAKRMGIAMVFALAMFVGLFWVIWLSGPWWWLAAAAVFFVVSVLMGQLFPVFILPLFYKIQPLEDPQLSERIEAIAEPAGLAIEGTYRMDLSVETVKANAMLAGLGRTRRVLLGDTLLENFSPKEILVVFAHEVGHHAHRHLPKMLLAGLLVSVVGLWLCDRTLAAWLVATAGSFQYGQLPVFALPMIMLVLTLFGLVFEPLQNTMSRHFERQADRYAVERTGMPEAFRSAFRKLARLNKDDPDPPRLEVWLWHSHPPIAERVAMAGEEQRARSETRRVKSEE